MSRTITCTVRSKSTRHSRRTRHLSILNKFSPISPLRAVLAYRIRRGRVISGWISIDIEMDFAAKIIRSASNASTPVRSSVIVVACIDHHDRDTRARPGSAVVCVHTRGLKLVAGSAPRTAVWLAAGHVALEEQLVDSARVVALTYAEGGAGIALPVCSSFVAVAAVAGCAHVGVVLISMSITVDMSDG